MDRLPLYLSTLCFLIGFARTVRAVRTGAPRHPQFNVTAMGAGFLFLTAFLGMRGHAIHHCPLTNLFEFVLFLSWSMVLLYLMIGHTYRLSLLGLFTEPFVLALQLTALIALIDARTPLLKPNPWIEAHAALSVVAYGAFGMACVAGVMYLAQEKQLKSHRLHPIFFQMPPITHLATANLRLVWTGFVLLSLGLLAGIAARSPVSGLKQSWGIAMWVIYLAILLSRRMGPRRVALFSVTAFLLALSTLGWLNYFTQRGHV